MQQRALFRRLCVLTGLGLTPTLGAVEQSDGTVIPTTTGSDCWSNVGICINSHELEAGGEGDVDVVATATIEQETFNPLCNLTFQVVARGASYENTFGWYEVLRDASGGPMEPALEDLHVFLGCEDDVGTERTLTVPDGVGEVGFFLANNEGACVSTTPDPLGATLAESPRNLFFSQRSFNPDADGLVHLLNWQSRADPEAFYFGWEDLNGGGDNDFEDLLTIVTGLECTGGGAPCTTDGKGVCGQGVMQCRDGKLVCVPTQKARVEACNALDDDCDGTIDDGDLCDEGTLCYRGECVPPCGGGEFQCPGGLQCDTSGVCLEPECIGVECPAGSVCAGGECVGGCGGVRCPYGQNCRLGVCVDVCSGMECDAEYACEIREEKGEYVGVCTSCECRGCEAGTSCMGHLCVDDACLNLYCSPGQHCVKGGCVDSCEEAVCPSGQRCEQGACVADPESTVTGGAAGAGAREEDEAIDFSQGGDGAAERPTHRETTAASAELEGSPEEEPVGCGCRSTTTTSNGALTLGAAFLALIIVRRRRDCAGTGALTPGRSRQ